MTTFEIVKSSHEIFRVVVDKRGVAESHLFVSDGRGGWKPTTSAMSFHIKHVEKIRALLAKMEGAQ